VAAYTTTQDGNWSATATWGGSGVPGNGDTATIAAGHDVTVDVDTTVGTSPAAGNTVLSLASSTATLTLAANVTLTVRGDCVVVGTTSRTTQITMNSGSTWKFDASLASSPSTTKYKLQLASASTQIPMMVCRGTPSSPCTVTSESASSAACGFITAGGFTGGGNIDAEWTNFSRIGDASQDGFLPQMGNASSYFRLVDCTVSTCGRINYAAAVGAASYLELRRTRWTSTAGSACINHLGSAAITSGTRLVEDCAFDKIVNFFTAVDVTFRRCYFAAVWSMTNAAWARMEWCLIRDTAQGAFNLESTVADCYILEDHSNTNPHGCNPLIRDRNVDVTRCIFEWTGTSAGLGDLIVYSSNPASGRTSAVTGCILLPNGSDTGNAGKLVALLGGTNVTVNVNGNTVFTVGAGSAETGIVCYGETYIGRAGYVPSLRSNIGWNFTGSTGFKANQISSTTTPTDCITTADYNCGHNLAAGSEGKSYNKNAMTAAMFTASTPGANDVDVNPLFVDPTRNLRRWGASRGANGTVAGALAIVAANPGVIPELIAWVRAGFEPRNRRLHNAGHTSQTIGAIEFTPINRRTTRRAS
jgi:hypothetical protein